MTDLVLQRAIDVAGGQSALARKIGTRQSLIWHWLTRSKRGVPAEWCLAIERETGVPAGELRPDLFGSSANCAPLVVAAEDARRDGNCPVPVAAHAAQGGVR